MRNFWPEPSKKKFVLIVTKVYNVWAAKVQRSYLSWHRGVMQILRKTDLWFEKWHEKFGKFSAEHLKVSKLRLWWDPFVQSRNIMTLNFTEELRVMKNWSAMKNNEKLKEQLTCHFENWHEECNQFWLEHSKI